jgi:hypothetical protein
MVFSGYLKKRGDVMPIWKSRYFEFTTIDYNHDHSLILSLSLSYFEYEGGRKRGEYLLTKTTKVNDYSTPLIENTFQIRDKRTGLKILLSAETNTIKENWMKALKNSIKRIHVPALESPRKPSINTINPRTDSHLFGTCCCGVIEFILHQEPILQGYCHCIDCQQYSSCPFVCLVIVQTHHIEVIKGKLFLGKYSYTPQVDRYFCRQCSSYLMHEYRSRQFISALSFPSSPSSSISSSQPSAKYTAVLAGTLPFFSFEPSLHVKYSQKVLSIPDGLPKYENYPHCWGGNDERIMEEIDGY